MSVSSYSFMGLWSSQPPRLQLTPTCCLPVLAFWLHQCWLPSSMESRPNKSETKWLTICCILNLLVTYEVNPASLVAEQRWAKLFISMTLFAEKLHYGNCDMLLKVSDQERDGNTWSLRCIALLLYTCCAQCWAPVCPHHFLISPLPPFPFPRSSIFTSTFTSYTCVVMYVKYVWFHASKISGSEMREKEMFVFLNLTYFA